MTVRELGRLDCVFIPAAEVQAHEACGWRILDDMAAALFANDEVLMAPPAAAEREAA
jgi:hypothetical protein